MANSLHNILKYIIFIITALILSMATLIVVFIIKHKATQLTNHSKTTSFKSVDINKNNGNVTNSTISSIDISSLFNHNCAPYTITYKKNYIAIYSSKCNILKLLNLAH